MARPREFDREEVLEEAIKVFADHGFGGTSTDVRPCRDARSARISRFRSRFAAGGPGSIPIGSAKEANATGRYLTIVNVSCRELECPAELAAVIWSA